ncbi:MAG: protein-methionine-sulfoxide reductase catalytic subunit MsrP [Candidatus Binatia bacterium]
MRVRRRGWEIPEKEAPSEDLSWSRRRFCRNLSIMGLSLFGGFLSACGPSESALRVGAQEQPPGPDLYPAARNPRFQLDRPLTKETYAASYNNFYEFSTWKSGVWKNVGRFKTHPWQVEITGLVERPRIIDVDQLVRMAPLEERLYRFRCVEAWAMAVPWTGLSLRAFVEKLRPLSSARYVRFVSFLNTTLAPNQLSAYGPWPYAEALTMSEALNDLPLLATGIYGRPLLKQQGAPLRLVVPWKYGFKSIKSIVKIEFTDRQPATFWNTLRPREYDFWANVNPYEPHPRWSQATERMIDTGERRPTLLYNGYAQWVSHLYSNNV